MCSNVTALFHILHLEHVLHGVTITQGAISNRVINLFIYYNFIILFIIIYYIIYYIILLYYLFIRFINLSDFAKCKEFIFVTLRRSRSSRLHDEKTRFGANGTGEK